MFSVLHVELTSRCNKSCHMCGRRRLEQEYPQLCEWGDMPFEMIQKIALEVPRGTLVQLHNNGEPTLYPYLGWALFQFKHCIRQFNTNGKLLPEKAGEIIDNLDILTISVIEHDVEGDYQYDRVMEFLKIKGDRRPSIVYRLLGRVDNRSRWEALPGIVTTRVLHAAQGSFEYERSVTKPEFGVCLDLLSHLAIDRYGNISMCVRLDPHGKLRLGNINDMSLHEAWTSPKRLKYIQRHIDQHRDECPGCDRCDFWGVPCGQ